jgi:hypothetical protein
MSEEVGPVVPERESVEDALLIVESYGPWGVDLNDAHRRQIVLADEVKRLWHLYETAVRGRADMRAALRTDRNSLLTPELLAAEDAAGGVFAAGALGPNVEAKAPTHGRRHMSINDTGTEHDTAS